MMTSIRSPTTTILSRVRVLMINPKPCENTNNSQLSNGPSSSRKNTVSNTTTTTKVMQGP